jgi:predicted ribosome quality control (RQC) complex YloA/Tae2 family protein
MALSTAEVAAVVAEIAPLVTGGRIQKVFQPLPLTLTFEIRGSGRTLTLVVSADPTTARLHLATTRLSNPPTPPSFCQYLRAHVEGARIESLDQLHDDRIVRMRLSTRQGPKAILLELTGRSTNILLLNGEDRILAMLHTGRSTVGSSYAAPTRPPASMVNREDTSRHERSRSAVAGSNDLFPVSAAVERYYGALEEQTALERLRAARRRDLQRRIKHTRRRIEALDADLKKVAAYKDYGRYGDLLKANLGQITKGQNEVTVVDYFDPAMPELVIPLDPAKPPQSNMEDYFRKQRKYAAAQREIPPRQEALQRELADLQTQLSAVQKLDWRPSSRAAHGHGRVKERLKDSRSAASRRDRPSKTRSGPYRRFTSTDGLPIYVGRNAQENEQVTFGLAHSDDLWLHARGVPGSHVVVRLERGTDVPLETLRDAATLALLYSDLKKNQKGEVIYTRRKYVRKMKRQPPGTVTVTQEKVLFLQLDKVRLERLKARQQQSAMNHDIGPGAEMGPHQSREEGQG